MSRALAVAIVASFLVQLAPAQSCAPQGVSVTAAGGRLGDAWRVDAVASPVVLGAFGLDLAPGAVPTPFGTICLGFTPNLQIIGFVTDAAGAASIGGVLPPNPVFAGVSIHVTAITFDPAQPTGIGIGNDASFTLRQPRFWFVSPGSSTPFGTTPGAIAATNGISDDVVFSQALTTSVRDAATAPMLGWLVALLGNGTLAAWDGVSAAPAINLPLAGASASAAKLLVIDDVAVLLTFGTAPSPFSPGTPGSVHTVHLPTSTPIASVQLPSGNPDAMIHVPQTQLLLLRTATSVVPFDYLAGVPLPPIALPSGFGGLADWRLENGLLYLLHGGAVAGPFGGGAPTAISMIDTGTLSLVLTNPLAMAAPAQFLRTGPGSSGPAVYVYGSSAGVLEEYTQGTVHLVVGVIVGSGIQAMELSSLGTQWLLLCNGAACGGSSLLQLFAGTTLLVPMVSLSAPQSALAVSPSASYGKAAVVLGTNVAGQIRTDPFTSTASTVLPSGAPTWWIRVD